MLVTQIPICKLTVVGPPNDCWPVTVKGFELVSVILIKPGDTLHGLCDNNSEPLRKE
jgi:hypothetical protein